MVPMPPPPFLCLKTDHLYFKQVTVLVMYSNMRLKKSFLLKPATKISIS